ncbi:MAG: hypothetical protein FWE68_02665, partial [Defluviitaleaceae bacterium]|nr:hypothetical protein [Defluviitaleaceae bacterium]
MNEEQFIPEGEITEAMLNAALAEELARELAESEREDDFLADAGSLDEPLSEEEELQEEPQEEEQEEAAPADMPFEDDPEDSASDDMPLNETPLDDDPAGLDGLADLFAESESAYTDSGEIDAGINTDAIDDDLDKALQEMGADIIVDDEVMDFDGEIISEPATIDEEFLLNLKIEEALEMEEDVPEELETGVEDFVKEIEVHSDEHEDFERPEKRGRFAWISDKIDNISSKFLLSAIIVLTLIVVLTGALAVNFALSTIHREGELNRMGTVIRMGSAAANNAQFIFLDKTVDFITTEFTLTRMNLSRVAAVLHFGGRIDLDAFDATLTDDWGRVYYLDYSYSELEYRREGIETRLWFDPLSAGFKYFDLTITERDTGLSSRTRFTAGQEFVFEPPRFIREAIMVDCGRDEPEVSIANAVFSNTGSQIMFAVKQTYPGEEVVLSKPGEDVGIRLTENGRTIVRDTHAFEPQSFERHGVTLGRVDFIPIQNINSTVRIHFDNMYRKFAVNRELVMDEIFHTRPNSQQVIDVGPYQLVIERGGIQGSQYVLVMHAIDT